MRPQPAEARDVDDAEGEDETGVDREPQRHQERQGAGGGRQAAAGVEGRGDADFCEPHHRRHGEGGEHQPR